MARLPLSKRNSRRRKRIMLYMVWLKMIASISWYFQMIVVLGTRVALRPRYLIFKMERIHYVDRLVKQSDDMCIKNLRMDMKTFHKLCFTLESRGYIRDTKYMNVIEQVAVFLYILAHHEKMSVLSTNFQRSTETISRHVHMVLNGVLRLQEFKHPDPIPNDSIDEKWKYFKNCLGALDGTHIRMNVPVQDKPRYRNRKGEIQNRIILACCVLHNYIRAEMNSDSCELDFDMEGGTNMEYEVVEDNITSIGTSPEWTSFRDNLAETLFNEWRGSSRR